MAQKIVVEKWDEAQGLVHCKELEKGNILYFPEIPFAFPQEEIDFLLEQRQGRAKGRKNIAYKPEGDQITNHDSIDQVAAERLRGVLRQYSQRVTDFLGKVMVPYAQGWKRDYASFRPFQEKGRVLRMRARNDLLHVDAFPTRPVHGARILRFFTNIHPTEGRRWVTSEPFDVLAEKYAGSAKLPFPGPVGYSLKDRLRQKMKEMLRSVGWKMALRSPYDCFMLRMHNFLKENGTFQQECAKDHWEFPPRSCWAVFTDMVSHAALSGQYALEQTFLVPEKALVHPEMSPVSVLERLTGGNMVNVQYSEALFHANACARP